MGRTIRHNPSMTSSALAENNIGQSMGAKGLRTRRRLIDATVSLLDGTSLRDIRVAQIARAAKSSPATFYVYFDTVQDAVLAAIAEIDQSPPELIAMLAAPWPRTDARDRARQFVQTYVDYWQCNRVVFRVRNLASEEGDHRFHKLRENAIRPLLGAIAKRIDDREQGKPEVPAYAQAGILAAMLERLSAIYNGYQDSELVTSRQLVEAAALVVADRLGGPG
jgi:AcrR family transcriptional regulator